MEKQLPEIFKELQEFRCKKPTNIRPRIKIEIRLIHPILVLLLIVSLIIISTKSNSLATDLETSSAKSMNEIQFEQNNNSINIIEILSENANTTNIKEVTLIERPVDYTTVYKENPSLPKGEEVILQVGKNGLEEVYITKIFENNNLVDEIVIRNRLIENYTEEIIELGTSEFLSEYKVHLGDTMYVKEATFLKELSNTASNTLCTINRYSDVKLLSLHDDWCKIDYENKIGYIQSSALTSAVANPEIAYENRKNKILSKLSFTMVLNEPSGLTLDDFKKLVADESKDKYKTFENNIEIFYNMEQKYSINGVFLLAIGIHESGWGTSWIAINKGNLFGFGAYDSDPYNAAITFETYESGIDFVAKSLATNYLNTKDTLIFDGGLATGIYYNGPTLSGVNVRYATDVEWASKVYNIMEYLYGKL